MLFRLPILTVSHICRLDCGQKQCRYLAAHPENRGWYWCLKTLTTEKEIIDGEANAYMHRYANIGQDKHTIPMGDNCNGYCPAEILEPT